MGGGHKIDHFVVDDINVWPLMCAYYWILLGFLHQLFTLERHKLSGSFINQSWFYNCFENVSSDIDCRRVLISFDFRKVNRMIYLYPTTWLSCHRFNSLLLSANVPILHSQKTVRWDYEINTLNADPTKWQIVIFWVIT